MAGARDPTHQGTGARVCWAFPTVTPSLDSQGAICRVHYKWQPSQEARSPVLSTAEGALVHLRRKQQDQELSLLLYQLSP